MNEQIKNGGYYLHANGFLIHKPHGLDYEDQDSPFVVHYWRNHEIGESPQTFTHFLKEAKDYGANDSDIHRLANHNKLSDYVKNWEYIVGIDPEK